VKIHQDARVYAALIDGDETAQHALSSGRRAYVHVARGSVGVNGKPLNAGDSMEYADAGTIKLAAGREAEVLLFDLP